MRSIVAHVVCGIAIIGALVGTALLANREAGLVPALAWVVYFGVIVPLILTGVSAIHPVTYQGLMIISLIQFGIVEWVCFQISKAYPAGVGSAGRIDIEGLIIGVVVTVPLFVINCVWLKILRHFWKWPLIHDAP